MTRRPLIADAMLGRLARWLRALGRDVRFDASADDDALVRIARDERRLLLTRDRRLAQRAGLDACLVRATKPAAQLRELDDRLGLFAPGWRDRLFTRCMVCNAELRPAAYRDVEDGLPAEVRSDPRVRSAGFRRCPGCRRVYWEGSHTRRMRRWLERVGTGESGR